MNRKLNTFVFCMIFLVSCLLLACKDKARPVRREHRSVDKLKFLVDHSDFIGRVHIVTNILDENNVVVVSSGQVIDVLKGTETTGEHINILSGSGASIWANNEYIAFMRAKGPRSYQPISDKAMAEISKGFVMGIWTRQDVPELVIQGESVESVNSSIRSLLYTDIGGREGTGLPSLGTRPAPSTTPPPASQPPSNAPPLMTSE
jgi:hypothetical protein